MSLSKEYFIRLRERDNELDRAKLCHVLESMQQEVNNKQNLYTNQNQPSNGKQESKSN